MIRTLSSENTLEVNKSQAKDLNIFCLLISPFILCPHNIVRGPGFSHGENGTKFQPLIKPSIRKRLNYVWEKMDPNPVSSIFSFVIWENVRIPPRTLVFHLSYKDDNNYPVNLLVFFWKLRACIWKFSVNWKDLRELLACMRHKLCSLTTPYFHLWIVILGAWGNIRQERQHGISTDNEYITVNGRSGHLCFRTINTSLPMF